MLPRSFLHVALLFKTAPPDGTPPPDWTGLTDRLNQMLGIDTAAFKIVGPSKTPTQTRLSNGAFEIHLSHQCTPTDLSDFDPVPALAPGDDTAPPALNPAHVAALVIKAAPLPETVAIEGLSPQEDQAEFGIRLRIAQAAALAAMEQGGPDLVHWGQSDQIFRPDHFRHLAAQGFALPLYVRAGLMSSGRTHEGRHLTGISAFGSAHLVGKHVEFTEDTQPAADSYAACLAYIASARATGRHLADGETFRLDDETDPVSVLNLPETPEHPEGIVRLTRIDTRAQPTLPVPPRRTKRKRRPGLRLARLAKAPARLVPVLPFLVLAAISLSLAAQLPRMFAPIRAISQDAPSTLPETPPLPDTPKPGKS